MKLKIEKLTYVETPNKAHETDAGLDFYIPNNLEYVVANGKNIKIGLHTKISDSSSEVMQVAAIEIQPQESVLIPMGIKTEFDKGYALVFFNRSSIASKKHLFRGACIVDSEYRGEIFVNLTNVSNETQFLFAGEKLIQAMLLPVPKVDIEIGKIDIDTERGVGGFGSSDKK